LREKNDKLASALMHRKRIDADAAGARILVTACTYCQLQFENAERKNASNSQNSVDLPAVLVSQVLGCAMGLSPGRMALPGEIDVFRQLDNFVSVQKWTGSN
jgi:heterodisulfide reductase subunit B